jgi:nicotinate phosphoribosyltransferase
LVTRSLLTDFYELTMAAGYFEEGKACESATFDLYYRRNPYGGGYAVAAGLEDAVRDILDMKFAASDLAYLRGLTTSSGAPLFTGRFLRYLSDFRFTGTVRAVPEGSIVFPNEPLVQVRGGLLEAQVVESILLCHVNFQTLIATKAARIWEASNHGVILEFGLRRAQGPDGALSACRAAFIGGAGATSNVLAAATLGIDPKGTHAHSWVQSFGSELEAFRAFVNAFPRESVLLVDTYDTLKSGIPNAITVAKELERAGHRLAGVRIDSGDLAFLSQKARGMLDQAGLDYVRIVASNELDEFLIADILAQGGKIDIWGVGTRLVVGAGPDGGALGGIYKLVEHQGEPKIKLSSNPEKTTNPGVKCLVRFYNSQGMMEADALMHETEEVNLHETTIIDPVNPTRRKKIDASSCVGMLEEVIRDGTLVYEFPPLETVRERRREQLMSLHESYRRLHNPHEYKVGITPKLWEIKERMLTRPVV